MRFQTIWRILGGLVVFGLVGSRAMAQIALVEPPEHPDPKAHYLFYLHGKIIEDQGIPAVSAEHGTYQYDDILKALAKNGFVVISEIRPKDTNPWAYAEVIEFQVRELIEQGVPAEHITLVGASKGAGITVLAADRLKNAKINVVLLAICSSGMIANWRQNGVCLSGRVLSIYDSADSMAGSCTPLLEACSKQGVTFQEIRLELGSGHGFLYRPLHEWIDPVVDWAMK